MCNFPLRNYSFITFMFKMLISGGIFYYLHFGISFFMDATVSDFSSLSIVLKSESLGWRDYRLIAVNANLKGGLWWEGKQWKSHFMI